MARCPVNLPLYARLYTTPHPGVILAAGVLLLALASLWWGCLELFY